MQITKKQRIIALPSAHFASLQEAQVFISFFKCKEVIVLFATLFLKALRNKKVLQPESFFGCETNFLYETAACFPTSKALI